MSLLPRKDKYFEFLYRAGVDSCLLTTLFDISLKQVERKRRALSLDAQYPSAFKSKLFFQTRTLVFLCRTLYNGGLSSTKIAGMFNVSEGSILNMARREDWILRRPKKIGFEFRNNLTNEIKLRIRVLYLEGNTLEEIASLFGLKSKKIIRDVLEELNVFVKYKSSIENDVSKKAWALYAGKKPVRLVSRLLGLTPHDTLTCIRRHGKLRSVADANLIRGQEKLKDRIRLTRARRSDGFLFPSFKSFSRVARELTRHVYAHNRYHISGSSDWKGFALDHLYSIRDAYDYYLETLDASILWVVCHPKNLWHLGRSENAQKYSTSWIELPHLRRLIESYNFLYGCPFERGLGSNAPAAFEEAESIIGDIYGYY